MTPKPIPAPLVLVIETPIAAALPLGPYPQAWPAADDLEVGWTTTDQGEQGSW